MMESVSGKDTGTLLNQSISSTISPKSRQHLSKDNMFPHGKTKQNNKIISITKCYNI